MCTVENRVRNDRGKLRYPTDLTDAEWKLAKGREQADREASPTAAIIDSQSVKSAETRASDRPAKLRWRQEDQRQEAAAPHRHSGPAVAGHRPSADLQDRDNGVLLMAAMFGLYPFLLNLYADGGYHGPKFQQGLARICRGVNVEIVRRCDTGKFVVLPKRWIVERTIALQPFPPPEQRLGVP